MSDTVFVNNLSAVHAGSPGQSLAFPDVNLCPPGPPAGPVPVPLPNLARAADLAGGASTVVIGGNPMGKKSSYLSRSTGNAVARTTGGGLMTHVVEGQARFVSHSMTVLVEGEPVPRHLDVMTHNHAAMPGEAIGCYMGSMAVSAAGAAGVGSAPVVPEPVARADKQPITFQICADAATWSTVAQRYRLHSNDGAYDRLAVEAGRKGDALVKLAFKNVLPGRRYTLDLEMDDQVFPVFSDVPFALLQDHQESQPRTQGRIAAFPKAAPPSDPPPRDQMFPEISKDDPDWYDRDPNPTEKP